MIEKTDVAQKREKYQSSLERALFAITDQLKSMPAVHRVILIGSYASGRRDLFTDLDLVVILDTEQDFVSRTAWLYQMLNTDVDLDLLAYTPEEFQRLKRSGFLKHALKTGKVVYERSSD